MMKPYTVVREPGQTVPDAYLEKMLALGIRAITLAVPTTDGKYVVTRKTKGSFDLAEAKKLLEHTSLLNRLVVVNFFESDEDVPEDMIAPFPVLLNEDKKPLVVAFLNGDFSGFAQEGSAFPPEHFCVEKQIKPRTAKAFKLAGGDLHKCMEELKDDLYANDWANMMIGSEGSIVLLAANGDVHAFLVEGETKSSKFDGWWASDAFGDEKPDTGAGDDLAQELGDEPSTKTAPKSKVAPILEDAPVAEPKRKPGHGLAGSKPPVATTSTKSVVAEPAGEPAKVSEPDTSPVKEPGVELADPESKLTIKVPPGMDTKRTAKWLQGRLPEGMMPKVVTGLKTISCKRGEATAKFLQTYIEQQGLPALGEFKSTTAPSKAQSPKPKVTPVLDDQTEGKPALVEPKKDDSPHHVGKPDSGLLTTPTPIFSPEQIEETTNFVDSALTKNAVDAHGKAIADPRGMAQMDRQIEGFSKQFGGKLTVANIVEWPLETWFRYGANDPNAQSKVAFFIAWELRKAFKMLDELTDPHHTQKSAEQKTEELPASQRLAVAGQRRAKVAPVLD